MRHPLKPCYQWVVILVFILLAVLTAQAGAAGSKSLLPPAPQPLPPKPALSPAQKDAQRYHACLEQAQSKPDAALALARDWVATGGGDPAEHCAALALLGLQHYAEGAGRLEHLAQKSMAPPALRAAMLAQAGQAWLMTDDTDHAYADQTAALSLTPDAPDLLMDRAETLALAKNYKAALADLNKVLAIQPQRGDALMYRASAKRLTGDLNGAANDIAAALKLDAKDPDAWLESGDIKRLKGDKNGARADWTQAMQLAPDSDAARDAKTNLERLNATE